MVLYGHDRLFFMNVAYGWAFYNPWQGSVLQPRDHGTIGGDLFLDGAIEVLETALPRAALARRVSGITCLGFDLKHGRLSIMVWHVRS